MRTNYKFVSRKLLEITNYEIFFTNFSRHDFRSLVTELSYSRNNKFIAINTHILHGYITFANFFRRLRIVGFYKVIQSCSSIYIYIFFGNTNVVNLVRTRPQKRFYRVRKYESFRFWGLYEIVYSFKNTATHLLKLFVSPIRAYMYIKICNL